MLVHLLSAFTTPANPVSSTVVWLRESAEEDPFGKHHLTDDPAVADIILFAENHPPRDPYVLSVRRHPLYRKYPTKSFLYQDADFAVPILRGIYPSIRRRDHQSDRCRSAGYIARLTENKAIRYDPDVRERKWLYSFFGEVNSPARRTLFNQPHPRGLIRDTTGQRLFELEPGAKLDAFTREYAASIRDSRFVLCPAGVGPLSYRLFETMEMGRVPVILSDDWVPPQGPAWNEFSLHLAENRIADLEAILSEYSPRHEEMGNLARRAWEQWYTKPVCFHRLVELCAELMALPPGPFSALRAWCTLMRPPHFRIWLRPSYLPWKRRLIAMIRRHALPK